MAMNEIEIPGGIPSINGAAGAITIAAGSGISVGTSGQTITVTNTGGGGGGGVTSVNSQTGSVDVVAGDNVSVSAAMGNVTVGIPTTGTLVVNKIGVGAASPQSKVDIAGSVAIGGGAGSVAAPTNGLTVTGISVLGATAEPDPSDPGGPHNCVVVGDTSVIQGANVFEIINTSAGSGYVFFVIDETNPKWSVQMGSRFNQPLSLNTNNDAPTLTCFANNVFGVAIGQGFSFDFSNAPPTNGLAVEGSLGVGTKTPSEAFEVIGNAKARHIGGNSSSPSIAAGSGAGTSPTISIQGTDMAGLISVTPGVSPAANQAVITATFNAAYSSSPYISLTPANAATAALATAAVYASSTMTTFSILSGSVPLSAATAYSWYYHIIQ